jgi:hypothetical protein
MYQDDWCSGHSNTLTSDSAGPSLLLHISNYMHALAGTLVQRNTKQIEKGMPKGEDAILT